MFLDILMIFKTICLVCACIFLILRFFFGDSMNDWYKINLAVNIIVKTFGLLAILGMIFFMADVVTGKVV